MLDLHSFGKEVGADIILGNNNGKTMNENLMYYINELFVKNDFSVVTNNPFRGGNITKHYGDKNGSCESLQIELSYNSYIDKRNIFEEELPNIDKEVMQNCKKRLKTTFAEIRKIK